jgi:hypothetical protein
MLNENNTASQAANGEVNPSFAPRKNSRERVEMLQEQVSELSDSLDRVRQHLKKAADGPEP